MERQFFFLDGKIIRSPEWTTIWCVSADGGKRVPLQVTEEDREDLAWALLMPVQFPSPS